MALKIADVALALVGAVLVLGGVRLFNLCLNYSNPQEIA